MRNKGFTLIEVITAMMVISILTLFILPMLVQVYMERASIQEEQKVNILLKDAVQQWLHENKVPQVEEDSTYELETFEVEKNQIKVCFSWKAKNNRSYIRCNYGKKLV